MKTMHLLLLLMLPCFFLCDPYPLGTAHSQSAVHPKIPPASGVHTEKQAITYVSGHFLEGEPLPPDYDPYGYNYRARAFKGWLGNHDRGRLGLPPSRDGRIRLEMRWNEAWLSGTDRDGDGVLDRHAGQRTYVGSGAWLTIHLAGTDGNESWDYFIKVAAVPENAVLSHGKWKVGNDEIGPEIWGCFAVILEFSTGRAGNRYAAAFKRRFPGFGLW